MIYTRAAVHDQGARIIIKVRRQTYKHISIFEHLICFSASVRWDEASLWSSLPLQIGG